MTSQLLRRRLIPDETVALKNDECVFSEGGVIVTKWKPIKPRKDIGGGESCYLIDRGIKVSRFYNTDGAFIYWYCDIIETEYNSEADEYIFTDLLADVVVYADGFVKVLDVDELAYARENGIIDEKRLIDALKKLSELLEIVYSDGLEELCGKYLDMAAVNV